jgi:hypothetical protein
MTALEGCGFGDVTYDPGTSGEVGATPDFVSGGTGGTGSFLGLPGCVAAPLSEACVEGRCPKAIEDAPLVCPPEAPGAVSYRHGTQCGGTALELDRGPTHVETWHFDGGGALTGVTVTSEQGPSCQSLAGSAVTSVWGEVCAPAGTRSNLCAPGCPIDACRPRADILGDFALVLDELPGMQLNVCRDRKCLSKIIDEKLELGQEVHLGQEPIWDGNLEPERATLWLGPGSTGLELHLTWILDRLRFPEQDLYLVSLGDPATSDPPTPVFETLVNYEVVDLGCAGSCRIADVDVRASATTEP